MKGSFILSLSLDILAIILLLVPDARYRWVSSNPKHVSFYKRGVVLLLLLAGFLIDRYITHRG